MKKLLLLTFTSCALFSSQAQQWWVQNSGSTNDFNTIFATNSNNVFAYGDSSDVFGGFAYGSQYKTTNQGLIWDFLAMGSPVYSARHSFFQNSSIGVLVGENKLSGNGFILTTNDGGNNWIEGVPHVERLEGVYFPTSSLGYACGRNDYAVRSVDGGATWANFNANTGNHLMDVFFTNPSNGYVVGRGGVIANTADSAINWTNQNSGTVEDLEGVWFINDTTGWAVGTTGAIVTTTVV